MMNHQKEKGGKPDPPPIKQNKMWQLVMHSAIKQSIFQKYLGNHLVEYLNISHLKVH